MCFPPHFLVSLFFFLLRVFRFRSAVSQHLNFEKSYDLQFPLLSDIGANVADLYGSKLDIPFMGKFANRLTFIIGSDGKIEKVRSCRHLFCYRLESSRGGVRVSSRVSVAFLWTHVSNTIRDRC